MKLFGYGYSASLGAISAMLVLGVGAQPVLAQDADAEAEKSSGNTIIVTAQRREESLQDVPVSLTAVTSDVLESRNLNDVRQINQVAPSVQIAGGNDGDTNIFIRGVGTLALIPSVESSVAIAVDNVNLGRTNLAFGAFDDVERVEALNGPQGLLFGRNASAGLLNIVTRRPELGEFSGFVNSEFVLRDSLPDDGFGTVLRGTVNVPLGENTAIRINTRYSKQDSIVTSLTPENGDGELENYGFRLKFLTEPSDNFEFYAIAEYAERKGLTLASYNTVDPAGGIIGPLTDAGITAGPENFLTATDGQNSSDQEQFGIQGTATLTLDNDWQIIGIAAYKELSVLQFLDSDRTPSDDLSRNFQDSDYSQFTGELRVAIPQENPVNGQFGLYYFRSEDDAIRNLQGNLGLPGFLLPTFPFCVGAQPPFGGPPPACPLSNDFALGRDVQSNQVFESFAAFGQLNFDLTDDLTLIAGLRWNDDSVSIDNVQQTLNYFVPVASPGIFSDKTSNSELTWRFGAQYDITDDVMVYGSYARGYKGPGFNDVFAAGVQSNVLPETSDAFEIGLRSEFADGNVVFNITAFLQQFDNFQAQSFDVNQQTFLLQNAAQLESKGIEAQLTLTPAEGLTINANATLLDATFDSFPGAECFPGQPGCSADNTFDASGQPLPGAADFTSTVQAIYEFPVSSTFDGFVEANWYHRSSINYQLTAAPATQIDAIDPIGASIGVDSGDLRISLFCRNCFNQVAPTNLGFWAGDQLDGLTTVFQNFDVNSVRNWGASLSYNF